MRHGQEGRRLPVLTVLSTALMLAASGLPDLGTSAMAQQPTTTRVSLDSTGAQGTIGSGDPQISTDGRWVAFRTASPLVAPDTNARTDVHLRDRVTGATRRISDGPGGVQADGTSEAPTMTPDGRLVAFTSTATNLVAGGTSGRQLFLFDRVAQTVRVAAALPSGVTDPFSPSISDDGSRIAFGTQELNTAGEATRADVYVVETAGGALRRVTQTPSGTTANGGSFDPELSPDGRWASFTTSSTNLVTPDTNGFRDVLATDLQSGQHVRISAGSGGGEANLHSSSPSMSFDGCIVAFVSTASNLVANDDKVNQTKAFARNRCQPETEIVSLGNGGTQGPALAPEVSADGCLVTFLAGSILGPPTLGTNGLALRDRCTGVTSRLDLATSGDPASGAAFTPAISPTGRYVTFAHTAANLVGDDTNNQLDVFVRDRVTNARPEAALTLSRQERRVSADASASRDPDGAIVTGSIAFGDGTPAATGLQAVHEYARGGTYTVTATITDGDGATATTSLPVTVPDPAAPPPPSPLPDPVAPIVTTAPIPPSAPPALVLDRVALSRSRFAVVPPRGRPRGPRGGQLTLRLSDAATVELRFERALGGRRAGGRCVSGRRRGARCVRYVAAGTLRSKLVAGTRTIVLTGRIGAKALRPGRHRLRVSARAADGRRSAARSLILTIATTRSAR